jgi:HEAT repeat protein
MKPSGPPKVTAAELMSRLNANPEWVAKAATATAESERRAMELRHAEHPLLEELHSLDYEITSVWDLVNSDVEYSSAIPVLVKHLQYEYPSPVREGIARALAVPWANCVWPRVVRLYRDERDQRVKAGLGAALSAMSTTEMLPELIGLVLDQQNGPSRNFLLEAIHQCRDPRGEMAIRACESDPELAAEALALRTRKRP